MLRRMLNSHEQERHESVDVLETGTTLHESFDMLETGTILMKSTGGPVELAAPIKLASSDNSGIDSPGGEKTSSDELGTGLTLTK